MSNRNDLGEFQARVSILNPPDSLTPLKFRGWLLGEVEAIHANTIKNGFVIIRLHITDRLRYQYSQQKLDKLLQKIVDKYPTIYRIELTSAVQSLSLNEMLEEQACAKQFLDDIGRQINKH